MWEGNDYVVVIQPKVGKIGLFQFYVELVRFVSRESDSCQRMHICVLQTHEGKQS